MTLKAETGSDQIIAWKALREKQRKTLLSARLLGVYGTWQREGSVCHLIAGYLVDMTPMLGRRVAESRDFR